MSLIKALIESQIKIKNAQKDAKNPHFKNDYATLESVIDAVKEIANANGIAIVQLQGRDSEGDYVETRLLHSSGETLNSKCYLLVDKPTMQGIGSAITYARRYNLAAMFCITQEDDDGNHASQPAKKLDVVGKKQSVYEYVIPIGKFKGKKLSEVNAQELTDYCIYIKTTSTDLKGTMKEFLDMARLFLQGN